MATRKTSNLPIDISAQIAAEAAEMASRISAPSGDRVQFKGNHTIVTPDGSEGTELQVVIIDFVSSNLFYPEAYDRDNPASPTCFAIGKEPSMLVPSENSPHAEAATCSTCPNDQFGTARQGKGKACKNTRLLAVADPNAGEDAEIWVVAVTPSALKTFDGYVKSLGHKHGTIPVGVVTRITLSEKIEYASPEFAVERILEADELEMFYGRKEEAMERLMVEPAVDNIGNEADPKPPAKKTPRKTTRRK